MNPEEYQQLFKLSETHWWFVGTRDILFASVSRDSLRGKPILDVGCGSGSMMRRFSEIGPVHGVDGDLGAVAHCRAIGFGSLCQGTAAALPFASGTFALAVAADLLEHCDSDVAVLDELYRVLAPGGILLISVPAHQALWSTHDVALHHKRRYSRTELTYKISQAGFALDRITFFNTFLFIPVATARLTVGKIRRKSSNHKIRYHENLRSLNRIMLAVLKLEGRLLERHNLPFGLSLLALASKRRG